MLPPKRLMYGHYLIFLLGLVTLHVFALNQVWAEKNPTAFSPSDIETGLVGRWAFNDGTNPTLDVSGNNHHATFVGNPTFTTDIPANLTNGYALDFNGVDDYLTVSDESAFDLDQLTVAFWINVDEFDIQYQGLSQKVIAVGGFITITIITKFNLPRMG